MSTLVVEINDAGVRAASGPPSGRQVVESPGYALIDEDGLHTGAEACDRARLKPRRVNDKFWSELSTRPLGRPFPDDVSHADLAHAHLDRLWAGVRDGVEAAILALPGTYSDEQLGLLLGIAQACGIPVRGMVDSAVAATSGFYPGGALLHIDLQLHRAVITELVCGRELVRRQVQVSEGAGLAAHLDAWGKAVAQAFIYQTRYDPLHRAASEQELFSALPDLLRRLHTEETTELRLDSHGKPCVAEISRGRLVDAVAGMYDAIFQVLRLLKRAGRPTQLLLSHRVAELPGFQSRLAQIGETHVVVLSPNAVIDGALRRSESILAADQKVGFVTRLPVDDAAADAPTPLPPPTACEAPQRPRPTHLVVGGVAHPINAEPFVLGVAIPAGCRGLNLEGPTAGVSRSHCSIVAERDRVVVEDRSTYGSFLNGQRIEGRAGLRAGDRLTLGTPGIELLLVAVKAE